MFSKRPSGIRHIARLSTYATRRLRAEPLEDRRMLAVLGLDIDLYEYDPSPSSPVGGVLSRFLRGERVKVFTTFCFQLLTCRGRVSDRRSSRIAW